MLNYLQAIILGLLQGATELFPVSSLGHSVILPQLFGWKIDQSDSFFLIFLVATHFATALAMLAFFYREWILIIKGFFRTLPKLFSKSAIPEKDVFGKLSWLLITGTIPAGLIGLFFQNKLQALLASPRLVALFLIGNGLILWGIEKLYRAQPHDVGKIIPELTWLQSIKVGLAQCLALIPGFSRTGATLGGGLFVGLTHEDAAHFAFLLATPIIFAAALLKLPQLMHMLISGGMSVAGPLFLGALAAFLAAYFSTRYLITYFKTKTLMPFAIYCVALGTIASFIFLVR